MKRGLTISFVFALIFAISFISAECALDATLLNQDPYPAVPGEYVKLVFQVTGTESPDCKNIFFELVPEYPIIFNPDSDPKVNIKGGTFITGFSSSILVPYKVRVDENSLDGENPIKVRFSTTSNLTLKNQQKEFNLTVEDSKTDFEVFIKDYDYITKIITFEILNIGKIDVQALTVDIPQQENIVVKGSQRNIVGDLDSNDYSTAEFEATPSNGEITLKILYTDSINVRREVEKTVTFNSKYFEERNGDKAGVSPWTYFIIIAVLVVLVYWWFKRKKNKKK